MAFLLDTNVVSEMRKVQAGKGDPGVFSWQSGIEKREMYISAITAMELEMGVLLMERKDATQGVVLRRWLVSVVLPVFESRILGFDKAVALRCAALHVPDPKPWRDGAIAATALIHDMTVATRNLRDFEGLGVALVNPWMIGQNG